ncbi:hypothetical protein SELMODRAFT_430558 [Selaginella moellendorffii]|uniref:Uncharacterized protein n=1 Tax=Selaginella moellendorffii TaxID=88036 RepID=D8T9S5_SELML|nr:hypothetical protein SELMODRAFT_430558 [Selaginella moellendorffii]
MLRNIFAKVVNQKKKTSARFCYPGPEACSNCANASMVDDSRTTRKQPVVRNFIQHVNVVWEFSCKEDAEIQSTNDTMHNMTWLINRQCPTAVIHACCDQELWGEIVHSNGAGPTPIHLSQISLQTMVQCMIKPEVKERAIQLSKRLQQESAIEAEVRSIHKHLDKSFKTNDYVDEALELFHDCNPIKHSYQSLLKLKSILCYGILPQQRRG